MAKQKKIIDIHEGRSHLVCIHDLTPRAVNPYRIYAIISAPGTPVRRRLLIKYADFMSVLYFIRDFYLKGLDALPVREAQEEIDSWFV